MLKHLIDGWNLHRLAVADPGRVAGWDDVVITASGPAQAGLYRAQLDRMRAIRRLGDATRTWVVEDPGGARIGSGGATLNALRTLAAEHGEHLVERRILLIHAGGDSKRLAWASAAGKLFVPLPLLAEADADTPTLADHLLALCAPLALALGQAGRGGLVSLTGDVLPLFPAGGLSLPDDAALVVTTPATLDQASHHGVILPGADGLVVDLVQKAGPEKLIQVGATSWSGTPGATALVDTGIWAFTGTALAGLAQLASETDNPVTYLAGLPSGQSDCSLYEDLASSFVPGRAAWLATRPLGLRLAKAVAGCRLHGAVVEDFRFVHLGTTPEYLDHLARPWEGRLVRRRLAEAGPLAAAEAVILDSRLDAEVAVGAASLVTDSAIDRPGSIGRRCVVAGVTASHMRLDLPDGIALWQVPVTVPEQPFGWVTLACGVDDNPKDTFAHGAVFGCAWPKWCAAHQIDPALLWPAGGERSLWTARLFPVDAGLPSLAFLAWLLAGSGTDAIAAAWHSAQRLSLAEVSAALDPSRLIQRQARHHASLVERLIQRIAATCADGDVARLARGVDPARRGELAMAAEAVSVSAHHPTPLSRRHRLRADLYRAAGLPTAAATSDAAAWEAITHSVAAHVPTVLDAIVSGLDSAPVTVELPVRFDLAGGWTDTPPYCLEQPAAVLNAAVLLDGAAPVGATASVLAEPRWEFLLGRSGGTPLVITDPAATVLSGGVNDPVALLKLAAFVCGFGGPDGISQGIRITAWSEVPKGSGLGTSSILAAAIVTALLRLAGRDASTAAVSARVLTIEQRLTTGGGWQDQLGGLVPGIKLLVSAPRRPLAIAIQPVWLTAAVQAELERRLVILHTGQTRLARDVLQRVVGRYLARQHEVTTALAELADCARSAAGVLAEGDLDRLAPIIREVWGLHQRLDPHCSNPKVDALLRHAGGNDAQAWKLAGAGGGGFAGILCPDGQAADRVRARLRAAGNGVLVPTWKLAI